IDEPEGVGAVADDQRGCVVCDPPRLAVVWEGPFAAERNCVVDEPDVTDQRELVDATVPDGHPFGGVATVERDDTQNAPGPESDDPERGLAVEPGALVEDAAVERE